MKMILLSTIYGDVTILLVSANTIAMSVRERCVRSGCSNIGIHAGTICRSSSRVGGDCEFCEAWHSAGVSALGRGAPGPAFSDDLKHFVHSTARGVVRAGRRVHRVGSALSLRGTLREFPFEAPRRVRPYIPVTYNLRNLWSAEIG